MGRGKILRDQKAEEKKGQRREGEKGKISPEERRFSKKAAQSQTRGPRNAITEREKDNWTPSGKENQTRMTSKKHPPEICT